MEAIIRFWNWLKEFMYDIFVQKYAEMDEDGYYDFVTRDERGKRGKH